jgi:hypothetical protein
MAALSIPAAAIRAGAPLLAADAAPLPERISLAAELS